MPTLRRPDAALLRARLAAQLLAGPPPASPLEATRQLLAVQAQDPKAFRLALRVRSRVEHASAVDHALTEERSMVVTWVNRGTLHLMAVEDEPLLHLLTTPQLRRGTARRLEQEGVSPGQADRAVELVVAALGEDGPQARGQLRERLERAGIPVAGQAVVHILFRATLDGHIVRGPRAGAGFEQAFVLARDWLGQRPLLDRDRALAELALRYLRGHGPADERDLAKWAQLPLRDTRAAFGAIAGRLSRRPDGRFELLGSTPVDRLPAPRLLGPFDPLLLGWAARDLVVPESQHVVTINGIFKAIALVRGQAVGTWTLPGGRVTLDLWEEPSSQLASALAREAAAVERFLAPAVAPS